MSHLFEELEAKFSILDAKIEQKKVFVEKLFNIWYEPISILRLFDKSKKKKNFKIKFRLQFWSESSMSIRSFCKHTWIAELWLGWPDDIETSTAKTVLMHSYKSDIADVLFIKFVNGSINFLPSRGSNGVNAPN